jgi:hypothetical protein
MTRGPEHLADFEDYSVKHKSSAKVTRLIHTAMAHTLHALTSSSNTKEGQKEGIYGN